MEAAAAPRLEGPYLRQAVEALSQGFALFDADDRLIFANTHFRNAYPQVAPLLVPGITWRVFLSEARRHQMAQGLNEIDTHLSTGGDGSLSTEGSRGLDRWVRIRFHPLPDGSFVLTETDVTAAKSAETLRQGAEELLRKVLEACAANIILCRLGSGEILYRTPATFDLFGDVHTVKAVYADPLDRSDFIADLLALGSVNAFETQLLRADGSVFPARISARRIDFGGEDTIVSLTQDMTQLYGQRDEIDRLNQRLIDAIEVLDQGFVLFDPDDRLIHANRVWHNVNFELSEVAQQGVTSAVLKAEADWRALQPKAVLWDRVAEPPPQGRFDFAFHDGRAFEGSRNETSDGGYVIAWRDVTQARADAQALQEQRDLVHQSEKLSALGETLAGVAHELNNPLGVVVGQALMLQEEVPTDLLHRVERIADAAERCSRIVKAFLAMARDRPMEMRPVDLGAVLAIARDVAGYSMESLGIQVTEEIAADLPLISADEDQLTQLFVNLLVNAEQALAGTRDPRVHLKIGQEKDRVVARIEDNGPGIPADIRARIFDPFFTTKDVGSGTGIGLSLCARIAAAHNGALAVAKSALGGAAFVLKLPVATDTGARPQRSEPAARQGLRALVIDDDVAVVELIGELLARIGVAPTVCDSAAAALSILEADGDWDVILSDLRMPVGSGLWLRSEIAAAHPTLLPRLAFMTGDTLSRDAQALAQEGQHPILEKPVLPADLVGLIDTVRRANA